MAFAKTDDRQYVRDLQSHALLNTDRVALERSRGQRKRASSLQQDILDLKKQVAELMTIVREHIKSP